MISSIIIGVIILILSLILSFFVFDTIEYIAELHDFYSYKCNSKEDKPISFREFTKDLVLDNDIDEIIASTILTLIIIFFTILLAFFLGVAVKALFN